MRLAGFCLGDSPLATINSILDFHGLALRAGDFGFWIGEQAVTLDAPVR